MQLFKTEMFSCHPPPNGRRGVHHRYGCRSVSDGLRSARPAPSTLVLKPRADAQDVGCNPRPADPGRGVDICPEAGETE